MFDKKIIPITVSVGEAVLEETHISSFEEAFAMPAEEFPSLPPSLKEPVAREDPPAPALKQEKEDVPRYIPEPHIPKGPNRDLPIAKDASLQTPLPEAPAVQKQASRAVYELLKKARAEIQTRKHKKMSKIMDTLIKTKRITNREVQKLIRVSDVTAFRYLNRLEAEGTVEQVGKTGKGVFYRLR